MRKMVVFFFCVVLSVGQFVLAFGDYESAYRKYLKGDLSGAMAEITKDIFSGARDPRLHMLMIRICKEHVKDYKQGIEYAIEGIRLFPEMEREFTIELGELYYLSGKHDKAEQILIAYNAKYPGDPRCLFLAGKEFFLQGKYYRAVSALEAAIFFGEKGIEVYEYLGKSYRKIGNYAKALEVLSYVYNYTKKEEILGIIIEISSIIDVDYIPYLSSKKVKVTLQSKTEMTEPTRVRKSQYQLPSSVPSVSMSRSSNIINSSKPQEGEDKKGSNEPAREDSTSSAEVRNGEQEEGQ